MPSAHSPCRRWCLLVLLVCLPFTAAWPAEDDKAARLERLRQQIQTLRSALNDSRGQQQLLRRQLQRVEKELGRLSRALHKTRQELAGQHKALLRLRSRRGTLRQNLSRQKEALRQQVLAAYAMGRQGELKIILNQQDPAVIGRTLAYYDYFNRARAQQIAAIQGSLDELASLEERIASESQRLEALSERQQRQMADKQAHLQQRQRVLAKLEAEIRTKEQRLAQYLQDERRLARLLDQLQAALSDIPPEEGDVRPFAALKGQLGWPTKGRISARYGERRFRDSKLKWQGIMIRAAEGAPVRSIHHGRVAFADWLRGFGLLIIIDH
ncbi:MAG: murein hydrolase activator EnvC family protein, partial [Gammaproteobacteria bacterium]